MKQIDEKVIYWRGLQLVDNCKYSTNNNLKVESFAGRYFAMSQVFQLFAQVYTAKLQLTAYSRNLITAKYFEISSISKVHNRKFF